MSDDTTDGVKLKTQCITNSFNFAQHKTRYFTIIILYNVESGGEGKCSGSHRRGWCKKRPLRRELYKTHRGDTEGRHGEGKGTNGGKGEGVKPFNVVETR